MIDGEYDMLWDQRTGNIDGVEYIISFYCYLDICNNPQIYMGKMLEDGSISDGWCPFKCENEYDDREWCNYPKPIPRYLHNQNELYCPFNDSCPLKKTYIEE